MRDYWMWVSSGPIINNRRCMDKLVNSKGKDVLVPVGEWECSPMRPESHGINVSLKDAALIEAAPNLLAAAKDALEFLTLNGLGHGAQLRDAIEKAEEIDTL